MDCSFSWMVDPTPNPDPNSTPFRQLKRVRSKKQVEFPGWGSRRLFEFLESIGRDTSNPISQYDVASIITDYVNQHKLQHPTKKKRIVCDDTLHSLFGRKTIGRVKIYDLLHQHFAENQQDDSTDDDGNDEDENPFSNYFLGSADDDISQSQSRQQKQKKPKRIDSACPPKSKSCFAAVIPENIKLVFLRRSLVEHLLLLHNQQEQQQPQNQALFEEAKVVGSLVRIKADPNDISQKNSHQLLQVTGLVHDDNVSSSSNRGVLLRLSGLALPKQVQISDLSDDNFSPEECEDFRQRIKDGLLKSLTVVELQEKVQMLHEDITKHWLVRELALLQKLIDRANEKGWRRELFEYLERRQLLQTPDEQARLLGEVPEVIADEIELEGAPQDAPDEVQEGNHSSPTDIQRGASETPICDMPAPICDVPVEEALLTRSTGGVDSEAGGAWSTIEDVLLCECWVHVGHCPVTGNEMKFSHMWRKIHAEFCERSGSTRTEMALGSRWKILNKELGKWRKALSKARDNHRSGQNLSDEIMQAQMWFSTIGQGKKTFNYEQCWEVVKNCSRFRIIPTGPTVVLNEKPLHDSRASDSPLDSPMSEDSPIEKEPRPIGRKAVKAKRRSNSSNNTSKFLEEIARLSAMRIEIDMKTQEHKMAIHEQHAKEREYLRKQDRDKKDRETMAMDTSHMSPETKQFWKLERRDVMRRKLFREDGSSNTDWLNDQNR